MKKSAFGFTLIELMIVMSIIALLTTIGVSLYGNAQRSARDTKRQIDIDAIAKALETNKPLNSTTYSALQNDQFANNAIPTDQGTSSRYCVSYSTTSSEPPAQADTWSASSNCPSNPGSWSIISTSNPPNTAMSWTICARLEASTGNNLGSGLKVYCRSSAQ